MKKLLFIVCLASIACKKKIETPPADFAPVTIGTNWTYEQTQLTGTTTFKLTVTNKDTTIGSRKYTVISNSAGSNAYVAKEGNDCFRSGIVTLPNFGSFEELYLKQNNPISTNWTQQLTISIPQSPLPLQVGLSYTIQELGGTKTVLGKNYTDVTKVRMDINVALLGGNVGGGDFFYARGIGMIQYNITTNAVSFFTINLPASTQSLNLKTYEIK